MRLARGATRLGALAIALVTIPACAGGGAGPALAPVAVVPPVRAAAANAYRCPTSGAISAGTPLANLAAAVTRAPPAAAQESQAQYIEGYVAVLARMGTFAASARAPKPAMEFAYPRIGVVVRIYATAPAQTGAAIARLRGEPGVERAGRIGLRRPLAVNRRYFTDDPYFRGFPPSTAPYFETAAVPGMWDMHAVGLDYAWEYAQPNNGSAVYAPLALGSRTVKVAVIDTGEDLGHPELAGGKVAYARCFITDRAGVQSTSNFVSDRDGQGTDVAGVAAENLDNRLGFAGAGGNVSLMAYRIFPTPDDNCLIPGNTDPRCAASTADVASAVDDAVANGARVINLSFGGAPCPDDVVEGTAIANAVASNVIVVASAGNTGARRVDAPACDPSVIAVGATGLADGRRNGTNHNPRGEYVASYSNYAANSPARWGLVAPGGDPYCPTHASGCGDNDYLHWITNIYTSTPLDAKFAGQCAPDRGNPGGPVDCRIEIAGTSIASPHVAGAAALILSVNSGKYGTPSAMFDLLCATADNLGSARQGCGRLNVYRAMAAAVNDPKPPAVTREP